MSDTTLSAQSAAAVCAAALPPLSSPERFCIPRDDIEGCFVLEDAAIERLFPAQLPRVIVTHTRPEPMTGILRRIDGGPDCTSVLGYPNRATAPGRISCMQPPNSLRPPPTLFSRVRSSQQLKDMAIHVLQ